LTGECCESSWQLMFTDTGSIRRARHRSGAWIRAASRARYGPTARKLRPDLIGNVETYSSFPFPIWPWQLMPKTTEMRAVIRPKVATKCRFRRIGEITPAERRWNTLFPANEIQLVRCYRSYSAVGPNCPKNLRILLANGSCRRQCSKARRARLGPRALVEPGHNPVHIYGGGRGHVLEMRLR
jgi:hypothetical protein